jgi:hypothetical protein
VACAAAGGGCWGTAALLGKKCHPGTVSKPTSMMRNQNWRSDVIAESPVCLVRVIPEVQFHPEEHSRDWATKGSSGRRVRTAGREHGERCLCRPSRRDSVIVGDAGNRLNSPVRQSIQKSRRSLYCVRGPCNQRTYCSHRRFTEIRERNGRLADVTGTPR